MLKLGFIFGEFLVVNFINLALEYPHCWLILAT